MAQTHVSACVNDRVHLLIEAHGAFAALAVQWSLWKGEAGRDRGTERRAGGCHWGQTQINVRIIQCWGFLYIFPHLFHLVTLRSNWPEYKFLNIRAMLSTTFKAVRSLWKDHLELCMHSPSEDSEADEDLLALKVRSESLSSDAVPWDTEGEVDRLACSVPGKLRQSKIHWGLVYTYA